MFQNKNKKVTFAISSNHGGPGGDQVDGCRRCVGSVHVANQFGQSKLPLSIGILLQKQSNKE
jgi:hypothetical protein